MKITLENVGVLEHAEFELGDLTIICGKNNSGKTYATHALHGFLHHWRELFSLRKLIVVREALVVDLMDSLEKKGFYEFDIKKFAEKNMQKMLINACNYYNGELPRILAASSKNLVDSQFTVEINENKNFLKQKFERTLTIGMRNFVQMTKESNSPMLKISLLRETEKNSDLHVRSVSSTRGRIMRYEIGYRIQSALVDIIYSGYFPNPFIISPERTGAALFKNELDFARNRIVEQLGSGDKDIDPFLLVEKNSSRYSLAVRENVDYIRGLGEVFKSESFLVKDHPDILKDLKKIVGGDYSIDKISGEALFMPYKSKAKLKMGESSSAARALLMFDVYLFHTAQKGDLLIVDEPELNLHPENQRRIARLFAQLVNAGIKVFLTTHSDYIIGELNNLIKMDESRLSGVNKIEEDEPYKPAELLSLNKGKKADVSIKAYVAEKALIRIAGKSRKTRCYTLVEKKITKNEGMPIGIFDETINKINGIQDEIDWGE